MSDNTKKTAGALALEACEKAYKDMTASEVRIGFGDCHCDWRAPLASAAIYKAAMDAANADEEEAAMNYAYTGEGEELTPSQAKDKADDLYDMPEDKKKMLKQFYPEVYAEKYPEEGSDSQPEDGQH